MISIKTKNQICLVAAVEPNFSKKNAQNLTCNFWRWIDLLGGCGGVKFVAIVSIEPEIRGHRGGSQN